MMHFWKSIIRRKMWSRRGDEKRKQKQYAKTKTKPSAKANIDICDMKKEMHKFICEGEIFHRTADLISHLWRRKKERKTFKKKEKPLLIVYKTSSAAADRSCWRRALRWSSSYFFCPFPPCSFVSPGPSFPFSSSPWSDSFLLFFLSFLGRKMKRLFYFDFFSDFSFFVLRSKLKEKERGGPKECKRVWSTRLRVRVVRVQ